MNIQINNKSIKLGSQSLIYDSYYFDSEEYKSLTNGAVLKEILAQWARALIALANENRTLFLPFNLEDEWIECFKATQNGGKIIFKHVWVNENGWTLNVSDLSSFITLPHETFKESPEVFAEYNKEEIISALINARVIDD